MGVWQEIRNAIQKRYELEFEDNFIFEFFQKLTPEKDIKNLIIKNNELTKILISFDGNEDKERKKLSIISQMNELLPPSKKQNLINLLKKILEHY